tara:strand:- start:183534 stop:184007 length:474 start_codon:yes stop_codon:yes gene_type:complete
MNLPISIKPATRSSRQPKVGKRGRRRSQRRTGAAMVEFAIIANILFVIVLTCIEFARMNMVRNLAQDAAYFAARQVIVPGATKEEAIQQAENIMDSMLTGGYTVDVPDFDFDSSDIEVTVTVDMTQVALFIPLFLTDHEIETHAVMRTERYEGFYEQ